MSAPRKEEKSATETTETAQPESFAERVASITAGEVVSSLVSSVVGAAVSMLATPLAGAAAAVATGAALRVGSELGGQIVDAASKAASEVGAAMSSDFGLGDGAVSTAVGGATKEHVVDPTTAELARATSVLTSEGHTLAGARGGAGASTATTEPSPETRAAAAKIAKAAENTDIGMAAHKAVKVDSKAPNAFAKIQALLLDATKTSAEKLREIGEIEGVGAIDDSSFKAFLGIAQAALGMPESKDTEGKISKNALEFLTNLSEGFAKIFTPEAGKSREGGAEEMNAAFAVCGEAMRVGIGKLPAMQTAVEANFKSGFEEAIKAAGEAQKSENQSPQVAQKPAKSSDKAELSLKEIGKDSLKIAGSIALSLLVPGGFLIAMAACYILREKSQDRGRDEHDADTSLPSEVRAPTTVRTPAKDSTVVAPRAAVTSGVAPPAAPPAALGGAPSKADTGGVDAAAGVVSATTAVSPTKPIAALDDRPDAVESLAGEASTVKARAPDRVSFKPKAKEREAPPAAAEKTPIDPAALERNAMFAEKIAREGATREARLQAAEQVAALKAQIAELRAKEEEAKTKAAVPALTEQEKRDSAFSAMMSRATPMTDRPTILRPDNVTSFSPPAVPAPPAAPTSTKVETNSVDWKARVEQASASDKVVMQAVKDAAAGKPFEPMRPSVVVKPDEPKKEKTPSASSGDFAALLMAAKEARTAVAGKMVTAVDLSDARAGESVRSGGTTQVSNTRGNDGMAV